MPVYAYKGVTQAGRNTRGFVDADSARAARAKLRRDGVFLTDLSESAAESQGRCERPRSRATSRSTCRASAASRRSTSRSPRASSRR